MQKAKLSWLFILNIFLVIVLVISLAKPVAVQSAVAGHVVISEVRLGISGGGTGPTNEYIELYNPSASLVNISGWKITKKTAAADPLTDQVLLTTVPAATNIASHGYYLIAHTDYDGAVTENLTYSTDSISSNNTIYLKNSSDSVIDKLGLGSTNDAEGTAKGNPPADGSVERKANSTSDSDSMEPGGTDVNGGNGEDTDNNSADFINRSAGDPQNSSSTTEVPSASPAPSVSPSASASASPSSSPSASPSPSASASASPSASPSASASASASPSTSPSPSPSASASASASPSASASASPSASASASVAPSASASASATPQPSSTPGSKNKLVCKFEPHVIKFGHWEFTLHFLSCRWFKV